MNDQTMLGPGLLSGGRSMAQSRSKCVLPAALATISLPLSACATAADTPALQQNEVNSNLPVMSCPKAKLTNRPDLAVSFDEAMTDACAVIKSDDFRSRVAAGRFTRKCPRIFTKSSVIGGAQVYRALARGLPTEFEVTLQKVGSGRVDAETVAYDRAMTIEPYKFVEWPAGDRDRRALTVNTLVHEMTHLVRESDATVWPLFQDEGGIAPWCNTDRLVSYALGEIAQGVWEAQHP